MAIYQLLNDQVVTIPIVTRTTGGTVEPWPVGDVPSVTSSDPASLNVVIGATAGGAPAVVINALARIRSGLSFTVTDSAGLTAFTQPVDIVEDIKPAMIDLDIADATGTSQPVPTTP